MSVRGPRIQSDINPATAGEVPVQEFISGEENRRGTLET
jgi:hypothetical protein